MRCLLSVPGMLLVFFVVGTSTATPPKNGELEALGRQIEKAVPVGDVLTLRQSFDRDAYFRRCVEGLDLRLDERMSLREGMGDVWVDLAGQIAVEMGPDGSYRFLRVVERPDDSGRLQPRLLFRLITAGGVNYHEHILSPDELEPRIIDTYVIAMDDTLAGAFNDELRRERDLIRQRERSPALDLVLGMRNRLEVGDVEGAVALFDAAPDEAKSKLTHFLRLRALQVIATQSGDYRPVVKALEGLQPFLSTDGAAAALMSIDALLLNGDHQKALAAIDRVDQWAGGDAYLDIMRANTHLYAGDLEKARAAAERVLTALPNLADAHSTMVDVALAQEDHETVLKELLFLEQEYGWEFIDLRANPHFSGFVDSPQYARWQRRP